MIKHQPNFDLLIYKGKDLITYHSWRQCWLATYLSDTNEPGYIGPLSGTKYC